MVFTIIGAFIALIAAIGLLFIGIAAISGKGLRFKIERYDVAALTKSSEPSIVKPTTEGNKQAEDELNKQVLEQLEKGYGMDAVITRANSMMGIETIEREGK